MQRRDLTPLKSVRRLLAFVLIAGLRLLVLCGGGGFVAFAQTAVDGAVAGRVLSTQGTPVVGASIVLRGVDIDESGERSTKDERTVTTGRDGSFLVLRLPQGVYTIEARDGERVGPAATVSVELGEVSEVLLHAGGTSIAAVKGPRAGLPAVSGPSLQVTRAALQDLPLEARQWEDVAVASSEIAEAVEVPDAAGAQGDAAESGSGNSVSDGRSTGLSRGGGLFSFRGIAPAQNASLVDGVSGDQGFSGGARALSGRSNFGQGSVRAFRVGAHSYSAQYGGGAGGLLSAATRGGGEKLRGGGFLLGRESAWAATNPFSVQSRYRDGVVTMESIKPHDALWIGGGHVGGAIARGILGDRVLGFVSIEQQGRNFPAVSSPTVSKRTGVSFYGLSATQIALLGARGVTANARNQALNYLDSLTGEVPRTENQGSQFARLDVRVGGADRVSMSYARGRLSSPAGSGGGPSTAVVARGRASVGDSTVQTDAGTVRWLHTFSPRLMHELRAQFAHDLEFERPRTPLEQEPAIGPGGFAPQVSIAGEFVYGTPAALGRNAYPEEQRWQLADVAQWAPGRHLLSMGFDWSRVHDRVDSLSNTEGSFVFDSGSTGGRAGGLVDWITDYTFSAQAYPNGGCPTIHSAPHFFCFRSFRQSFGQQQVELAMHDWAGFAQDLWHVRPGLSVELGVRYEYTLLPLPQKPNAALDAIFHGTGATGVFPEDRNNVGPRVAVAWAPRGAAGLTARLGYGAYYGRLPGARVRAALENTGLPSSATNIHITPTTVTACPQVANQGFGYPCAYVSAPPAAVAATTSADLFAHNFRLPALQQVEVTLEREFGPAGWVRATYSTAMATQLPNTVDVNIAPAKSFARFVLQGGDRTAGVRNGDAFAVPLYTARVATQFGAVTALESNANATWHGATVEARVRRGGAEVHGSYTWSKAIDYGAEQGLTPRVNGQFDPFDVGYDKGLADSNFPQRFAGSAVWTTHAREGRGWTRRALGGWRLAAIGTAGSGRAYSYEIFGGDRLSGGSYSINGSGGSAYLPTVGRNTLRLPMRWNVDARVGRGFRITERLRGEGYVEAFNVGNHGNASRVNTRAFLVGDTVNGVTALLFQDAAAVAAEGLTTPAFGDVTSSTTGLAHERVVQAGLRIAF